MIIKSDTLKALRKLRSMSQGDLSRATNGPECVSISTIKRIEGAKGEYEANPRVAKKLAEVLKVQPVDLAKEPQDLADQETKLREFGYRPLKAVVDGETALAFQVVELLYGIPIQSQILMAPLFSALLAEGSFAWRREQLAAIDEAADHLMSLGGGHLSFAFAAARAQDGSAEEEVSISIRDLFGNEVGQRAFDLGYDPSKNNPFAVYLRAFAAKSGAKEIAFDPDDVGDWKTFEGLPEYRIAPELIENLTGGDHWAEFALLRGYARIRDIPEELKSAEATSDRIKWLASRVPAEERARQEAMFKDIAIDLGLSG